METHDVAPEQTKILVRYKAPNRFDIAPYGQVWKVFGEGEMFDIWVQISKFEAEPCWVPITYFFDKNFQDLLKDPEFIDRISGLF